MKIKNDLKRWLRLAACCGFLAAVLPGVVRAASGRAAGIDPFGHPALITPRALHGLILAVARADRRLVAVGERGIILLSDDDGKQWRQSTVPVSLTLTSVTFVSAKQGWAVGHGGVVLHSADGGESWSKQLDGKAAADIELSAARQDVGPQAVQRLSEAERLVADGADKPLLDVHFFDEHNGLVVGAYGLFLVTSDGGKSWQSCRDRLDNPKGKHLYAISADGADVIITGEQGALFRSTNGGKHFSELRTPYAGSYFGVIRGKDGPLVVFGLRGNAYVSSDKGLHWERIDTGSPVTLSTGRRLSDGNLILADETGRVLHSTDGGFTFHPVHVDQPLPFTSLTQAADGRLIFGSVRGPRRVDLGEASPEKNP